MTVPSGIHVPGSYIDINNSRAINPFATDAFRVCVFGEHDSISPSSPPPTYERILSETDAYLLYGVSPSFELCRAALRNIVPGTNVELYCVSEPVVKVTRTARRIEVTLPSGDLKKGTLQCYQNGVGFTVDVVPTDSVISILQKIQATTNIVSDKTVTKFAVSSPRIVLTTIQTGISSTLAPLCNGMVESYPGGPELALETAVGSDIYGTPTTGRVTIVMESAAAAIDVAEHIAVLPQDVIDIFVNPYTDATNYGKLQTEVDRRFSTPVQLEGHQVITKIGTTAEMISAVSSYNDMHLTVLDGGNSRPAPAYVQSAIVAGIMASSLSEDPVIPMQAIKLIGAVSEPVENQRTYTELNTLIEAGVATSSVNAQGEVLTNRITTSYTETDSLPDVSYRDANTIFTTSYLRQSLLRLIAVKYKNFKLADDGIRIKAGQKVITPARMTATLLGWFVQMEKRAIVENYDQFKQELLVIRHVTDRTRLDAVIPTDVINQFRVFAGELQFIL